ncbi:MAG: thioredoxin family protein [Chloroflexota bacterium]
MHVVEVLGPGCQKCQYTEKVVREVIAANGVEAEVRHVTDYVEIASRGVMATPALVVDGTVVLAGRIPTHAEVATWLASRPS